MTVERVGYGAGPARSGGASQSAATVCRRSGERCHKRPDLGFGNEPRRYNGEVIGYCTTLAVGGRALDVYTTPIQMKKNRPGVMLSVLCPPEKIDKIERILFRETGTLGVRRWPVAATSSNDDSTRLRPNGAPSKGSWAGSKVSRRVFLRSSKLASAWPRKKGCR